MSARVFWRMNPGRNVVNLNWNAITADSVISVSASEYTPDSQQLPDTSDQRFVGAASIRVANITPHGPPFDPNHGVTFVVEVDWRSPLNICTDVSIINNAPVAVVYVGPQTESRQTTSRQSKAATGSGRNGSGNGSTPAHTLEARVDLPESSTGWRYASPDDIHHLSATID